MYPNILEGSTSILFNVMYLYNWCTTKKFPASQLVAQNSVGDN